jgi:CheY-like chemotaxis protein
MDLHMPDLGGDEAARRIRRLAGLAELPIITTSASVEGSQLARSAAAGCDGFLPKPIDLAALLDLLQRRLDLTWLRAAPSPIAPLMPPPPGP